MSNALCDALADIDLRNDVLGILRRWGRDDDYTIGAAIADLRAALAQPAPEGADSCEPHKALMRFYGVDSIPALIDAQAHHIERLQAKLPPTPSLAPTFPRG